MQKYLRFARAAAMVAMPLGCGGSVTSEAPDAKNDTAHVGDGDYVLDTHSDDALLIDVPQDDVLGREARPDADRNGICHNGNPSPMGAVDIACPAGAVCRMASGPSATLECTTMVASTDRECGAIRCGDNCYCASAADSRCDCRNIAIGPLPPPELSA